MASWAPMTAVLVGGEVGGGRGVLVVGLGGAAGDVGREGVGLQLLGRIRRARRERQDADVGAHVAVERNLERRAAQPVDLGLRGRQLTFEVDEFVGQRVVLTLGVGPRRRGPVSLTLRGGDLVGGAAQRPGGPVRSRPPPQREVRARTPTGRPRPRCR